MAVKIRVQLVLMPSSAKRLIASRPFSLIATLTTMFGASLAKCAAFLEHPVDVVGDDLGRDRAGGDRADLLEDLVVGPARPWRRGSGWWSRRRARPSGRRSGSLRCRRCRGRSSSGSGSCGQGLDLRVRCERDMSDWTVPGSVLFRTGRRGRAGSRGDGPDRHRGDDREAGRDRVAAEPLALAQQDGRQGRPDRRSRRRRAAHPGRWPSWSTWTSRGTPKTTPSAMSAAARTATAVALGRPDACRQTAPAPPMTGPGEERDQAPHGGGVPGPDGPVARPEGREEQVVDGDRGQEADQPAERPGRDRPRRRARGRRRRPARSPIMFAGMSRLYGHWSWSENHAAAPRAPPTTIEVPNPPTVRAIRDGRIARSGAGDGLDDIGRGRGTRRGLPGRAPGRRARGRPGPRAPRSRNRRTADAAARAGS